MCDLPVTALSSLNTVTLQYPKIVMALIICFCCQFLNKNSAGRLSSPATVKRHPLFKGIEWEHLQGTCESSYQTTNCGSK